MRPQVRVLREFRDRILLTNKAGKVFVGLYYLYSKPAAEFVERHPTLRVAAQWSLLPLVCMSWMAVQLGPTAVLAILVLVVGLLSATVLILRWQLKLGRNS